MGRKVRIEKVSEEEVGYTSIQGCIGIGYQDIVEVFGEPNDGTEWFLKLDGVICTIYHYKSDENVNVRKVTKWHVGGFNEKAIRKVVKCFEKTGWKAWWLPFVSLS